MALRYEDLLGEGGLGNAGTQPLPTGPSLPSPSPSASAPAAPAPGAAAAPIAPGLQGPYFQPGAGNDASAGLSALSSAGPNRPVPQFDDQFFGQLRNTLSGVVSGRDVPFTDRIIRGLKGNAFAAARDQAEVGAADAASDSLRRGVYRSAAGVNDAAAARDRASAQGVAATANIDAQAAQANFNARMSAIQQGKALLDQLAERIRSQEALGVDVARARADLMLGYDRIAAAERQQHNDLNAALERQIIGGQMGA